MYFLRDCLFTAAGFAIDDHTVVCWSHTIDLPKQRFEVRTIRKDILPCDAAVLFGFSRRLSGLGRDCCLEGLTNGEENFIRKERFGDIVICTEFNHLYSNPYISVSGDDNHRHITILFFYFYQEGASCIISKLKI